jgi:hypothetical protein
MKKPVEPSVGQTSGLVQPTCPVPAAVVTDICAELEAQVEILEKELRREWACSPKGIAFARSISPTEIALSRIKFMLNEMRKRTFEEPTPVEANLVTVYGKEMTAHDAAELATFAKALRDKACPYCAQPIHVDKQPAQKSGRKGTT